MSDAFVGIGIGTGGLVGDVAGWYTPAPLLGEGMGMTIDLHRIEDEPVAFGCDVELEPERVDPDRVDGSVSVRLDGQVQPAGDVLAVVGRCSSTATLACSRCLAPVAWTASEEFALRYRVGRPTGFGDEVELGKADLDVVWAPDGVLDLEQLAADQTLLNLPMRTVCRPDCAGLCPVCGADRNLPDACRCELETDPRWSALADLRVHDS